jgi:DNA polymerase III subunit beta
VKFSLPRDRFLAELGVAVRGVSVRSAIQTLSGIMLVAQDGGVELQSTDMELGIRVRLDAPTEREGSALVPGRLLLDVVRSLPGDDLTLEARGSEGDVELSSGSASFRLRTLPPEDFPALPEAQGEPVRIPADAFSDTVAKVARAASRDETRPHLTGVLVSASESELRMVATDSYRLAVKEATLAEPVGAELEANVPARVLQELTRIASAESAGEVAVSTLQNQVVFEVGTTVVSSRLVEGRFPNYRQLLPESYEHELRVDGAELLAVVRRVSLLAQRNAPLRMRFSEGELEVSARTPDVGEARETLPAPFRGEILEIGFNPEFLRDGLESAESDDLVLKLISPLRPGLIQAGSEGDGFQYLVMPIRLNV